MLIKHLDTCITVILLAASSVLLSACPKIGATASFDVATQTIAIADAAATNGTVTANVALSNPTRFAVRVPYSISGTAVAGQDYTGSDGVLTFPPGQTAASVSLALSPTAFLGSNLTIILTLGDPENALLGDIPSQTITLQGGAGPAGGPGGGGPPGSTTPSASFDADPAAGQADPGLFMVNLTLTSPSSTDLVFPLTVTPSGGITQGTDFSVATSQILPTGPSITSVTVPANALNTIVFVNTTGAIAPGESIGLTLAAPSGATLVKGSWTVQF